MERISRQIVETIRFSPAFPAVKTSKVRPNRTASFGRENLAT